MTFRTALGSLVPALLCTAFAAAPAFASEGEVDSDAAATNIEAEAEAEAVTISAQTAPGGAPPFAFAKPVFDKTWATIGLGAGLVPSYAGSNDYVA
jgi:hypothetical protein